MSVLRRSPLCAMSRKNPHCGKSSYTDEEDVHTCCHHNQERNVHRVLVGGGETSFESLKGR
jgi:hypothetical protein